MTVTTALKSLLPVLKTRQTVIELLTCILAFSISFPNGFSAYTLGVWALVCSLLSIKQWTLNVRNKVCDKGSWPLFSLLFLFFFELLSASYATEADNVFDVLFNSRVNFLIIPAVVILADVRVPLERLLKAFIWGVSCFIVYSVICAICNLETNALLEALVSTNGSSNITLLFYDVTNRAYSNANVVLALIAVAYLFYKKKIGKTFCLFYGFVAAMMLAFLLVNTSRMVVLAMLIVAFFAMFMVIARNLKLFAICLGAFLLLTGVVMLTENRLSTSLYNAFSGLKQGTVKLDTPRPTIWKAAIEIDQKHYLYGYGAGCVLDPLVEQYRKCGFSEGVSKRYTCHSQYLEYYLEFGVPGLLILCVILGFKVYCTPLRYRKLSFLFILFFALIMLTECYISRSAGSKTFAFFFCLVGLEGKNSLFSIPPVFNGYRKIAGYVFAAVSILSIAVFCGAERQKSSETYILATPSRKSVVRGENRNDMPIIQFDSHSRVSSADGNAFAYLFFFISRNQSTAVEFDVDCFVSSDFNGSKAEISNVDADNNEQLVAAYDLRKKGTWQTLSFVLPPRVNYVYLKTELANSADFSNLNGKVLFNNPRWFEVY